MYIQPSPVVMPPASVPSAAPKGSVNSTPQRTNAAEMAMVT